MSAHREPSSSIRNPGQDPEADVTGWLVESPGQARSDLLERLRAVAPLLDGAETGAVVDRALSRVHGLGPVGDLLADPEVTEVMINGAGPVWIDRAGEVCLTGLRLEVADIVLLIDRVLDPLGLRVDRTSPVVDARTADGSRVNVVVEPIALDGPIVTIRRFSDTSIPLSAFAPDDGVALLEALVAHRVTMAVVGGTGAGKTTLLNALGAAIPDGERLVVIEDTSELRLPGSHVIRLEARPSNAEGVGAFSIGQLVRNALRMRPDRLVIGEVRGGEALDLLLALNTGHDGSMVTCHANDPDGGLRRLETLALMGAVELPLAAIRQQLLAALDVIVHVGRDARGSRSVLAVSEVDALGDPPRCAAIWTRSNGFSGGACRRLVVQRAVDSIAKRNGGAG